jgi:hypothetical protein
MDDRMNERLERLADRFRAAQAAVDASQASLRKRSAEKLATLMSLSARQRLRSLRDPDLTAFDREQIERSLEGELPRQRPLIARAAFDPNLLWRFVRHHRRALLRGGVAVAPLAWFGGHAVLATPARAVPVKLMVPFSVEWAMPGGDLITEDLGAESDQIWVVVNGQGRFRRWVYGRGYAFSGPMPDGYLNDQIVMHRKT